MIQLIVSTLVLGFSANAAIIVTANNQEVSTHEYDMIGVEKIVVDNSSGAIAVMPTQTTKVYVTVTKRKFSERCQVKIEKTLDNKIITTRVERAPAEDCDVNLELRVPKTADLELATGSGSINVKGIEGLLSFNVGSGSVQAEGNFKKLEGKSGSGDVDIQGLKGGGSLSVGSGSISLSFKDSPIGDLDVKTGSGDATLVFPKGSRIKADLSTGSGDLKNELGHSQSAEFGVTLKTGSGDIQVKSL